MKNIHPLPFIIMGIIFLLISILFYPSITQLLIDIQSQNSWTAPRFWDLTWVLMFVRIIFILIGVFLTGFGIGLFWMRRK